MSLTVLRTIAHREYFMRGKDKTAVVVKAWQLSRKISKGRKYRKARVAVAQRKRWAEWRKKEAQAAV